MHDQHRMADFEYVLVPADRLDLTGDGPVSDFGVPMYPVLRRVQPGDHESFDGEVLAGVKATIRRS